MFVVERTISQKIAKLTVRGLLLLATLYLAGLKAAEVDDLYSATVEVDQQDRKARAEAAKLALQQVLVKVSGQTEILTSKHVQAELPQAFRYLSRYRFVTPNNQLAYLADFNRTLVDELVTAAGYSVWDANRPQIVLWLAIDSFNGHQPYLLTDSHDSSLSNRVSQLAQQRGIPLILPLMDMQDSQNISFIDVWGGFDRRFKYAGERYAADMQVIASIKRYRPQVNGGGLIPKPLDDSGSNSVNANMRQPQSSDGSIVQGDPLDAISIAQREQRQTGQFKQRWQSLIAEHRATAQQFDAPLVLEWAIISQGKVERGMFPAQDVVQGTEHLINFLGDYLLERFAGEQGEGQPLDTREFVLDGVSNLTALISAQRLLQDISLIKNVTLITLQGQRALFKLQLFGETERLRQQLALRKTFVPHQGAKKPNSDQLIYVWQPG